MNAARERQDIPLPHAGVDCCNEHCSREKLMCSYQKYIVYPMFTEKFDTLTSYVSP